MNKNVLVVDDEEDIRDYLKMFLQDKGYSVRTAADGIDAMKLVQDERPDLIFLDLQMPNETGTGFYRKLRHKTDLKNIPVVIVSAMAGRNVAVNRSVPVIDKPFEEDRILEVLNQVLA